MESMSAATIAEVNRFLAELEKEMLENNTHRNQSLSREAGVNGQNNELCIQEIEPRVMNKTLVSLVFRTMRFQLHYLGSF